ncbi:MAG: hypothetical protein KDB26_16155, partial [Microthrixaceae bacterium]|nr:hypothetical protein [Microthrixaceae bacterium]
MTNFKKFVIAGSVWIALGIILPPDLIGINYVVGAIVVLGTLAKNVKHLHQDVRPVAKLIVLAGALSLSGVILRVIHGAMIGVEFPFPSPADALTLLTYPVFIFAIIRIV